MSSHHGILVHVVFSTKYRKPMLCESWRDGLFAYIGGTIKEHDAVLIKSGGTEDHVHLLIRFHPKHSISATIKLLKANSSRWINEHQNLPRKFSWQPGYGAFSVSVSNIETVKSYIGNQAEHHKSRSFRDEFLALLDRHGMEFDERYVFENENVG